MLMIVKATYRYWEFIRKLRNTESVKRQFITQTNITPRRQQKYMKEHSHNYYIGIIKNIPIGFVGCINDDIRIAITPTQQGKGFSTKLLLFINKMHPSAIAKIKLNNKKSIAAFTKAGFKKKYYILERDTR